MKKYLLSFLAGMLTLLVTAAVVRQSTTLYIIDSPADEIKIKMRSNAQTASWIEAVNGTTNVFTVTASGGILAAGIQTGTVVSANEFLKTNTFSPIYSVAPVVTLGGPTNAFAHIVSVTESNVVIGVGRTNCTVYFTAIGTP